MIGRLLVKDIPDTQFSTVLDRLESKGKKVEHLRRFNKLHSLYIYEHEFIYSMGISTIAEGWFKNHSLPELQVSDILKVKPLSGIYDS